MAINDPALERLPPHDIDAEEAVLGSVLIEPEALLRINSLVDSSDFFRERNRLVFEAVSALFDRGAAINLVTAARELEDMNRLESIGGPAYLSQIVAETPTSLHAEFYAAIVRRTALQRRLIGVAGQIAAIGYDAGSDIDAALSRSEELILGVRQGQTTRGFLHIRDIIDQYFEASVSQPTDSSVGEAIPTGFTDLDRLLGGFKRSDLVILAARPGLGKSSFALNIAQHASQKGATTALFSLEMAKEQLVQRLLASEAGIDSQRLRLDLLTDAEQERLMEAIGRLSDLNIYIDDTPMVRVSQIRSRVRRLAAERRVDMVIVDYLQLIHGSGAENRVQEVGEISRSLKGLAREMDVPVVALSQLSRAVESRSPHIPMLSDLRESGSIEQDADVVMFIYREDVYYTEKEWERKFPTKPYPRGIADIIVAKHRNGPTGQISLLFFEKMTKFVNLSVKNE